MLHQREWKSIRDRFSLLHEREWKKSIGGVVFAAPKRSEEHYMKGCLCCTKENGRRVGTGCLFYTKENGRGVMERLSLLHQRDLRGLYERLSFLHQREWKRRMGQVVFATRKRMEDECRNGCLCCTKEN